MDAMIEPVKEIIQLEPKVKLIWIIAADIPKKMATYVKFEFYLKLSMSVVSIIKTAAEKLLREMTVLK